MPALQQGELLGVAPVERVEQVAAELAETRAKLQALLGAIVRP